MSQLLLQLPVCIIHVLHHRFTQKALRLFFLLLITYNATLLLDASHFSSIHKNHFSGTISFLYLPCNVTVGSMRRSNRTHYERALLAIPPVSVLSLAGTGLQQPPQQEVNTHTNTYTLTPALPYVHICSCLLFCRIHASYNLTTFWHTLCKKILHTRIYPFSSANIW